MTKPFVIPIDHQSLKYLLEQKATTSSQQHWVAKVMQYKYEIQHKKGNESLVANALSWLPSIVEGELNGLTNVVSPSMLLQRIESSWKSDDQLQNNKAWIHMQIIHGCKEKCQGEGIC